MRRQAILLLTAALGVALAMALTACGDGSNASGEDSNASGGGGGTTASGGNPYDVNRSIASLQDAGWKAKETEGIPDTYSGVQQVGYLKTTAPDGEQIDQQFFESPDDAQKELDKTKKKESPFDGVTIGNVMVFDPKGNDTAAVSQSNLDTLQGLLK